MDTMIDSCIVNEGEHIEVICYYTEQKIENSDNTIIYIRKYVPSHRIDDFEDESELKRLIGLFRVPNYNLFYKIKTESLKVHMDGNNFKVVYSDPLELQKQIMNKLLYAYQDQNGSRIDIVAENADKYLAKMDANIMLGLYREFINKCGVNFED